MKVVVAMERAASSEEKNEDRTKIVERKKAIQIKKITSKVLSGRSGHGVRIDSVVAESIARRITNQ
jgi:hypothetical protein